MAHALPLAELVEHLLVPEHHRGRDTIARIERLRIKLRGYRVVEIYALTQQVIAEYFGREPDCCKVWVRAALGTPIDWIAWELGVTRDTIQRRKWKAGKELLEHLEVIVDREQ